MPRLVLPFLLLAALLTFALARAASPEGGFDTWTLEKNVSISATFQSHNTKVLAAGRRGAIVSLQTLAGQDDINEFEVVYVNLDTRRTQVLLSGVSATNAPCLAEAPGGEFAVFINDHRAKRVLFKAMRMNTATASAQVTAESEIDSGVFGKYACAYAAPDFLFIGNNGVLIRIDRDGSVKQRLAMFERSDKKSVSLQYPQLVAEDGVLLLAVTTAKKLPQASGGSIYWSIMFLRSTDQGRTWFDHSGARRALPLPLDYDASLAITPANGGSDNNWLLGLDLVHGTVVTNYSTNRRIGKRNPRGGAWPVMMFWPLRENASRGPEPARLPPDFASERQSGFFVEDPLNPDDVYFVTFEWNSLIVLKSRDRGESWKVAGRFAGGIVCPYAIDGTRQITQGRRIFGVFTDRGKGCGSKSPAAINSAQVKAFQFRVTDE